MVTTAPHVLLLSNRDDFTSDYVATKLDAARVPYLRINSEDITELHFSLSPGQRNVVTSSDRQFNLETARSVFFRRLPTDFPLALNEEDTEFINRERRDFLEGLFLALNAKWINPLANTVIGERKILQLAVARQVGLQIPNTLVTNDAKQARQFLENTPPSIIKPISHGLQRAAETVYSIYTSTVSLEHLRDEDGLMESPILLQEKIHNERDIRITVVGNELFAVEIEKENSEEIDWRKPTLNKTFRLHNLPADISAKLIEFVKSMGLTLSAIDLILTPDNHYVFLESNPAGEWLWLELELGIPISQRIISALQQGK